MRRISSFGADGITLGFTVRYAHPRGLPQHLTRDLAALPQLVKDANNELPDTFRLLIERLPSRPAAARSKPLREVRP